MAYRRREAKTKIIALAAKSMGMGSATFELQTARLAFFAAALLGRTIPDRLATNGQHRSAAESELPLVPPPLEDFKPTGTGEPPLAKAKDWIRYSDKATRETNTMPQWAGSCWYYLRFCDPQNDQRFVGEEAEQYWMGGPKPGGRRSLRRRD